MTVFLACAAAGRAPGGGAHALHDTTGPLRPQSAGRLLARTGPRRGGAPEPVPRPAQARASTYATAAAAEATARTWFQAVHSRT